MEERIQYNGIDVIKFIMAVFVVVLHTHPLEGISELLNFLLSDVIGRAAVPFFFAVTGFLLEQKMTGARGQTREVVCGYVRRILGLYVIWTLIYLPIIVWDKLIDGQGSLQHGIFTMLRDFLFAGSYAHLWYLPAAVVGVLLTAVLTKYTKERNAAALLLLLFGMGLLTQSYFGLLKNILPGDGVMWQAMKAVKKIMVTCRNGIFFGSIFIYMGKWIAGHKIRLGGGVTAAGLIVSTALLAMEERYLRESGFVREQDMYLMLLPTAFFLTLAAIQLPVKADTSFLRKMSMNIFYVHMIFKFIYRKIVQNNNGSNVGLFLTTLTGAVIIAYVMYRVETKSRK